MYRRDTRKKNTFEKKFKLFNIVILNSSIPTTFHAEKWQIDQLL